MKTLSYWASRHKYSAIFLIILGEVVNGFNGVLLGANLLDEVSLVFLYASMLVLIGLAFSIQYYAIPMGLSTNYWLIRRWVFMAFLGNFLLFGLLGGIWNQRIQTIHPSASVLGNRRIVIVSDSVSHPDSVQRPNHYVDKQRVPSAGKESNPRTLYIILGIVGIIISYVLAGLACNILCAGYGFGALLTFYLGMGGLAGAFYFFSRAFQRPPKRRRDMTSDERRRDSKRFWLSWLILIGVASVALLIGAKN